MPNAEITLAITIMYTTCIDPEYLSPKKTDITIGVRTKINIAERTVNKCVM